LEFSRIKTEKKDSVGKIILNNPKTLNVIEKETFHEIGEALDHFEKDDVKVILITAVCGISRTRKKVFSAGVNLKKYNEKIELAQDVPERFKGELKASRSLLVRIEKYSKPVIIAINGLVTGGFFELALSCDTVLVSESSVMSLNEVNIGLIPGYGGLSRLLNLVGKNRAFDLMATARLVDAKEAFRLGIATKIFKNRGFDSQAIKYCRELAEKSSNSLYLIKDSMRKISEGKDEEEIEVDNFLKAICSEDAQKGVNNFLRKK